MGHFIKGVRKAPILATIGGAINLGKAVFHNRKLCTKEKSNSLSPKR